MSKFFKFLAVCLVLALAGVVVFRVYFSHSENAAESEGEGKAKPLPVAHVEVMKLARKTIQETATAYGTVISPATTIALPFESRMRNVLVNPGQAVANGEALIEFEPSAAAQLQYQQAQGAVASTQKELQQTRARFEQKLAVNTDLNSAEKAARDAQLQLESLERQGLGQKTIKATSAGVVTKVNVQNGQIAPASSSLLEFVARGDIEVELYVDPQVSGKLHAGDAIELQPLNNPGVERIPGKVRLVTESVEPATRMVDVYVTLPADTKLLVNGSVRAGIPTVAQGAFVVPRNAVLADEGEFSVYTVRDHKAVKHLVKIGIENETETQITADDLHEGDTVVTAGNYELEDGMLVLLAGEPEAVVNDLAKGGKAGEQDSAK